ncbi:hypothetical protein TYRP_009498 [Tyrophagus putrescentiae]|nr:hypothetical protein TYRP_009498 [Tyrophagus putrescentiae]
MHVRSVLQRVLKKDVVLVPGVTVKPRLQTQRPPAPHLALELKRMQSYTTEQKSRQITAAVAADDTKLGRGFKLLPNFLTARFCSSGLAARSRWAASSAAHSSGARASRSRVAGWAAFSVRIRWTASGVVSPRERSSDEEAPLRGGDGTLRRLSRHHHLVAAAKGAQAAVVAQDPFFFFFTTTTTTFLFITFRFYFNNNSNIRSTAQPPSNSLQSLFSGHLAGEVAPEAAHQ